MTFFTHNVFGNESVFISDNRERLQKLVGKLDEIDNNPEPTICTVVKPTSSSQGQGDYFSPTIKMAASFPKVKAQPLNIDHRFSGNKDTRGKR